MDSRIVVYERKTCKTSGKRLQSVVKQYEQNTVGNQDVINQGHHYFMKENKPMPICVKMYCI